MKSNKEVMSLLKQIDDKVLAKTPISKLAELATALIRGVDSGSLDELAHSCLLKNIINGISFEGLRLLKDQPTDLCEMPDTGLSIMCRCGLPAPIEFSDSKHWNDILGYKKHRMRIQAKCAVCGERSTYRLGGYVVKHGEFVKGDA